MRGVELATGGGDLDRPRLVPQLCLLFCDDDGGAIAPGRQPFERLGHDQLLIRTPAQVLPFVQAADGSAASCRIILIEAELLGAFSDGVGRRLPRFHSLLSDEPRLSSAARALWESVDHDDVLDEQQRFFGRLLLAVIDSFATHASRPAPLTTAVARARDLLHERFAEELRLDEIARAVAMSKCHLVHLFHKELGLPPHAYQIQLRVAHARRLVASGTPLAEVASLTGFADQSHLTRLFKRIVGVPPGRYAARTVATAGAVELHSALS